MTYLFKLSRRSAMSRYFALMMALLVALAACTSSDAVLSPSDTDPTNAPTVPTAVRQLPDSLVVEVGQAVELAGLGPLLEGESATWVEWTATGGTITSSGLFTSTSTGEFKVTRRRNNGTGKGNKSDTTVVVVTPATLESLVIAPDTAQLTAGAQQTFAAKGRFSDGTIASVPATWQATGGVTTTTGTYTAGLSAGQFRVIAASTEGPADTATVLITATTTPQLVELRLTPSSVTLAAGASQQFSAKGVLQDGSLVAMPVRYFGTGGTIGSSGVYVAGSSAGAYRVIATDTTGRWADTAAVSITTATAAGCASYPHSRRVDVSTASGLASALGGARAGDLIVLAEKTYVGHFKATVSGTASQPIVLCGTRAAVIDGGMTSGGGFAITIQASHWTLAGFTVTNTHQGVRLLGSRHSVIRDLAVHKIGQEAISVKGVSKHNLIENNLISNTGLSIPEYGEGIYLGSAPSQWCTWSNCKPDQTDSNTVRGNTIGPYVRSELIDAKEGTAFNRIENNVLDGKGQVNDPNTFWIDSWVEINGDDYVVTGNRGMNAALKHGFQTYRGPNGWGNRTYYAGNTADLAGASGYGIAVDKSPTGVTVRCDNVAKNAGSGLSNVSCK